MSLVHGPFLTRLARGLPLALLLLGPAASAQPARAHLEIEQLTYLATRGTQREFLLAASRARYRPEEARILLEDVRLEVAATPDVTGFAMTCERGELDLVANDFVAEGRVRGSTRDGRRIATERLRYDHAAGVVSTNEAVEIRDASGLLRGGGFRYDVRAGRFVLRGGATVVQEP